MKLLTRAGMGITTNADMNILIESNHQRQNEVISGRGYKHIKRSKYEHIDQ